MAGIYVLLLDTEKGAIDWISYSRAHFLESALPSCKGIYLLSDPPRTLKSEPEGWMVFMIAHGDTSGIGHVTGEALASMLSPHLPKTFGVIHLQSCATGSLPARSLTEKLGELGHNLVVKAPATNATFTLEIGFRALDMSVFDSTKDMGTYRDIKDRLGSEAEKVTAMPSGSNLSSFCRNVANASTAFWAEFSKFFAGVAQPMARGWKAYQSVPGQRKVTEIA